MILKAVVLFLLFIAVMGMIQKALRPGSRRKLSALDKLRCQTCRRVHFSDKPTACDREDCRYR